MIDKAAPMLFRPLPRFKLYFKLCSVAHDLSPRFGLSLKMTASYQRAAGDGDGLPADPRGVLGGQKRHGIGDVPWRAHAAHRDGVDEVLTERGWPVVPLLLIVGAGRHEARRDRIHGDAGRPEFLRHLLDE